MTREEAIKIINCYDIGFYDLSGEKIPADKLVDAFDMAIEALQAEPAKHGKWKIDEYGIHHCPFCYAINNTVYKSFCPNCGAKMDKGGDTE